MFFSPYVNLVMKDMASRVAAFLAIPILQKTLV